MNAANYIGMCYRHINDYELAVEAYSNALKIDSKDGAIYFNNGILYEEMGQKDKAAQCYESALFLDPDLDVAKEALEKIESEPV